MSLLSNFLYFNLGIGIVIHNKRKNMSVNGREMVSYKTIDNFETDFRP